MKYDISNLSGINRRVRLVPRDGATVTLPEVTVNPTLLIEEDGSFAFCLAPPPPTLGISCAGALDRTGAIAFDGPVTFKIEPNGESFTVADEAALIALIKSRPDLGLIAKNLNRPKFEMILPINTVPGVVDSELEWYPRTYLTMVIEGTNFNNEIFRSTWGVNLYGDSIEYPANSITDGLVNALFPDPPSGMGEFYAAQIKVTTTEITDPDDINELVYRDELVDQLPMTAALSGTVVLSNATSEITSSYDMKMYGLNVDLSGVNLADVVESCLRVYNGGDNSEYADRYFKTIDKVIFAAPDVFTEGILGEIPDSGPDYARQPKPHYPFVANTCLTKQTISYKLGSEDIEFTDASRSELQPIAGEYDFISGFNEISKYEVKLEASKMAPNPTTIRLNGMEQIPWDWDGPNYVAAIPDGTEDALTLLKIQLPELVGTESLKITTDTHYTRYINAQRILPQVRALLKDTAVPDEYAIFVSPNADIESAIGISVIDVLNQWGGTYQATQLVYSPASGLADMLPAEERVIYLLTNGSSLKFEIFDGGQ